MTTSTSLGVAVHALAMLAYRGELTNSETIAKSINTNPVVVRRVMAKLVKAAIVTSSPGKHGGFKLARSPRSIKVVDVLRALDEGSAFRVPSNDVNPSCAISCNMKAALTSLFDRVDDAVERELGKTTLADVVRAVS